LIERGIIMLQEATKLLNSAFHGSFIKRLSLYLHDCVREEVKSATFRNLKQDKDNKWIFLDGEEKLFANPQRPLKLDGSNNKITELMLHAEISQKEKYLIYGYLFLSGRSSKRKNSPEFLTPLLYMPCKLERDGININCSLTEESLSLNTGALAGLIKQDDEDEVEHLFEGLIDVVPDLPLTDEKVHIFLTTLKSIIPDLDIESCVLLNIPDDENNFDTQPVEDEDELQEDITRVHKRDNLSVTRQTAIILTKRPSITAGVLHELTQISEKPSGVFRETALNIINQEYLGGNQQIDFKKSDKKVFVPVTPLALSDSQTEVLKAIEESPLVSVYGPPGTGKSQTIVNLVSHLIANGKTVLVASRMDKAVDVVVDRLNSLGAPYLSLRAGRSNYQKQLNFELQELLSNKVDLDTGYESSVLVDVEDMHNLFKTRTELENKCEQIIKLEHEWYTILQEYLEYTKDLNDNQLIKRKLTENEIDHIWDLTDKIEKTLDKTGLISTITRKILEFRLNRAAKLSGVEYNYENIENIRQGLRSNELYNQLRSLESKMNKIGNLHQLLEAIRETRKKQRILAVDILKNKRRESLKDIVRDQVKRQRLIVHSKALIERKKNLQNRLLEDEDFRPLLEAFPCWAVTTYAISESLPLKPGLFDVAIIDEASQCDIASCFPVLFRAKKAVIVGDDKQLPHMSFLEKAKEQSFLSQHNIPDKYQLMWRFRTNSMFDLANYYSSTPIMLDEHYRSLPPIINFSNEEFYGGRIRVMNKETDTKNCIELCIVQDGKVDLDTTRNMAETEKIMEKLQEIILADKENNPDKPSSIGIISPFRGQVELIQKAIAQVLTENTIRRHKIEVGTAHTFQGDERDIILLSLTLAPNSHFQSLTFLQKPNLFNVAITRAKKKMICFISQRVEDLPSGLVRSYLEYIRELSSTENEQNVNKIDICDEEFNNNFEKEVAQVCRAEGLEVIPGFESAGFKIDLVVSDGQNKIALECDGVADENTKHVKQVWKQSILERCGWTVMRLTAREWYYSKKVCMDRIKKALCTADFDIR